MIRSIVTVYSNVFSSHHEPPFQCYSDGHAGVTKYEGKLSLSQRPSFISDAGEMRANVTLERRTTISRV